MNTHVTPDEPMEAFGNRKRQRTPVRLPTGLAAVQLILAYEWLISGINKLLNPTFTLQLASTLRQSMSGNPYASYVSFLRDVVLPHASLFGFLTEVGELAIGVALISSAALWIWRPSSHLTVPATLAACVALAGAAFLSLNYFLQGGSPLPWINPANAFNEGVDIDILIPLLAVALLIANLGAVRGMLAGWSAASRSDRASVPWAS